MKSAGQIIRLIAVPVAMAMFILAAGSAGGLTMRMATPIQSAMIRSVQ